MNKIVAALLVSQTAAADWNYLQNGADWGEGCTDFGITNQTPINMITPGQPGFGRYPVISSRDEQNYFNQYNREVNMNGHTS